MIRVLAKKTPRIKHRGWFSLLLFLVMRDSRMYFDIAYIHRVQLPILLVVHDVELHWSCSHICS